MIEQQTTFNVKNWMFTVKSQIIQIFNPRHQRLHTIHNYTVQKCYMLAEIETTVVKYRIWCKSIEEWTDCLLERSDFVYQKGGVGFLRLEKIVQFLCLRHGFELEKNAVDDEELPVATWSNTELIVCFWTVLGLLQNDRRLSSHLWSDISMMLLSVNSASIY